MAKRRSWWSNAALRTALIEGAGAPIDRVLGAGGLDYAYWRYLPLTNLFQDTSGTTPVTTAGDNIGLWNAIRKVEHNAQQATGGFQGKYQTDGVKFDGLDDRMTTGWLGQNGNNCTIIRAKVPASLASSHFACGAANGTYTNNWLVGFATTGQFRLNCGQVGSTQNYGPDMRGQTVTAAVAVDGTNAYIYVGTSLIATVALTGSNPIGSAREWLIGAYNNDGTPSAFFGGNILDLAFGKVSLTLADYLQIYNQINA